jgi:hypothetical protein
MMSPDRIRAWPGVTQRLPHGVRDRCGFEVVVAILPLATVAYLVAERISRCRGHAGPSPWRPDGERTPVTDELPCAEADR